MKATKGFAVGLLILSAAACGKRDNVPGQTNTTSGDYDQRGDISGAPAPAAPIDNSQAAQASPPAADTSYVGDVDKKAEADKQAALEAEKAKQADTEKATQTDTEKAKQATKTTAANAKKTTAKKTHAVKDDAKDESTRSDLNDTSRDTAGTTTITSGAVESSSKAEEPKTPQASEQVAPAEPQKEENNSTVLGTGKSGMYTDGQGTYGGKATWGTGVPKK